jgi:hypothetical protein
MGPLIYLRSTARFFLICLLLGVVILALKAAAYRGYLAHGEWRQDALIWLAVWLALSFLSPAIDRLRRGYKDSK